MIDITYLGEKIRKYRKELGITQTELAQKLNISFQAVSNWERGAAPPDLDNIVKIAHLFDVTVDSLLNTNKFDEPVYLGIDGGATKTEYVVFTSTGKIVKKFRLEGSNPNDIGVEKCATLLSHGIDLCLNEFPTIDKIFAGISGIGAGSNKKELHLLLSLRYKTIKIEMDHDAANVFSSSDIQCASALICGTGSVVFARIGSETKRLGGWGYLFDKYGSAYDIGKDAISACLSYEDGLTEYTKIYPLLCSALDSKNSKVWDSVDVIYKNGKSYIAGFAPLVFKAYAAGDAIAERIIDENISRLAMLINNAIKISGNTNVIACGGLFEHFGDTLFSILNKKSPEANFVVPDLPPIYGACKECLKRHGIAPSKDFHDQFYSDYNKNI
jgi:N-acetylglucosamine kinase-like BadF-type ATPase